MSHWGIFSNLSTIYGLIRCGGNWRKEKKLKPGTDGRNIKDGESCQFWNQGWQWLKEAQGWRFKELVTALRIWKQLTVIEKKNIVTMFFFLQWKHKMDSCSLTTLGFVFICFFLTIVWMFCWIKHWCAISVLFAFIIVNFLCWAVIMQDQFFATILFQPNTTFVNIDFLAFFMKMQKYHVLWKEPCLSTSHFSVSIKLTASLIFSLSQSRLTVQEYWIIKVQKY